MMGNKHMKMRLWENIQDENEASYTFIHISFHAFSQESAFICIYLLNKEFKLFKNTTHRTKCMSVLEHLLLQP